MKNYEIPPTKPHEWTPEPPFYRNLMIHSQRLMGFLCYNGFVLINTSPSRENPLRNVYWFRHTADIDEAIAYYKEHCLKTKEEVTNDTDRLAASVGDY